MLTNLLTIFFLPLLSFVILIFFGKRLPRKGDWVGNGALFIALILSIIAFWGVFSRSDPNYKEMFTWNWFNFGDVTFPMGILFDNLTAIMLVVVTLVSFCSHFFSIEYMHGDAKYSRYFAYLGLFTFSMLGLILCDNLLALYIFWELVGLTSYLLIGFWFEKKSAADAGKKAFLTTRVGDVGMFIGILIIFTQIGSFRYEDVFAAVADGRLDGTLLTIAGVCLFAGAVGKSAQFPLHIWLPDAMEGPTPVSALIHAATMVAAGVYLVGRLFLVFTPDALLVIAYIGGITAFFAATIAIVINDIKRVLAFSTISQLAYMMLGLGVGGYVAGLFHLTTHAFFKALLFLGSGSVIHALHTQDIREMGGLRKKMPVTFITFLFGTLALSGIWPFAGFFSKDAILGEALSFGMESGHIILFILALVGAGMTAFYMFRLIFKTFTGEPRDIEKYNHAHESGYAMLIPLVLLAFLALTAGWGGWFQKLMKEPTLEAYATTQQIPVDSYSQFESSTEEFAINTSSATVANVAASESTMQEGGVEEEHHDSAHTIAMVLSIVFALSGIGLSYLTYYKGTISAEKITEKIKPLHNLLSNKYYIDEIYSFLIIRPLLRGIQFLRSFDLGIIDGAVNGSAWLTRTISFFSGIADLRWVDGIVNAVANVILGAGSNLRKTQTGRIQNYLLGALGAVIIIMIIRLL